MAQKIVLIGSSTGGPGHLKKLLLDIDINNCTIIIAQHMSLNFMDTFIQQIKDFFKSETLINKIDKKVFIKSGVYVCTQNSIILPTQPLCIAPYNGDIKTTYNPNVDMLFSSAAKITKFADIMAILLTGIGDDGAKGLFELYKAKAQCVAENEESAIVYGMPKRAKELNPQLLTLNLANIKLKLESFLKENNNE
ncbi:chemotaxis protein CheB [Campylobacter sp. RM12327]|uniref:CheB methylesterase domain-containing protein n=1 Tax=Campylobacter sputorum TaxID=206 RepID=UPI00053C0213|nr:MULTISPECIES: CheB methylesterase domain-containing protein [Campylobacter]ASM39753.1 MCP protein-glutamate methylesterase [Campylobacter sputorum]MBF6668857.1 chemotaxis protein CheB [Campylobacter sp. RM12327]MBF6673771.1 chemotaxis protein CheB [Campylobacter sp. RM13538]MBF6676214.1 chemotaxis protein CheB [Campylobacter sp. RM12321]MBF6678149.1 chemotaxis protein CheB [Campylobacter sp. RM11259]